ncbi:MULTISPECIES: hypothetical protein [Lactobacillus]|uniref:hypothetical protein n=1 Tax=Lactobacillus TaxID=1578 RepID=UPI0024931F44|nr:MULTISPECIES: hypothetical protein [Lactobacillus]
MSKRIQLNQFLNRTWPFLIIILATLLLAEIQLSNGQLVINIDTIFHYNRFYDAEE